MSTDDDDPVIVAPAILDDVFLSGVLPPEDCGEYFRIVGVVDQKAAGQQYRRARVSLVLPRSAFFAALYVLMAAMPGAEPASAPTGPSRKRSVN